MLLPIPASSRRRCHYQHHYQRLSVYSTLPSFLSPLVPFPLFLPSSVAFLPSLLAFAPKTLPTPSSLSRTFSILAKASASARLAITPLLFCWYYCSSCSSFDLLVSRYCFRRRRRQPRSRVLLLLLLLPLLLPLFPSLRKRPLVPMRTRMMRTRMLSKPSSRWRAGSSRTRLLHRVCVRGWPRHRAPPSRVLLLLLFRRRRRRRRLQPYRRAQKKKKKKKTSSSSKKARPVASSPRPTRASRQSSFPIQPSRARTPQTSRVPSMKTILFSFFSS